MLHPCKNMIYILSTITRILLSTPYNKNHQMNLLVCSTDFQASTEASHFKNGSLNIPPNPFVERPISHHFCRFPNHNYQLCQLPMHLELFQFPSIWRNDKGKGMEINQITRNALKKNMVLTIFQKLHLISYIFSIYFYTFPIYFL